MDLLKLILKGADICQDPDIKVYGYGEVGPTGAGVPLLDGQGVGGGKATGVGCLSGTIRKSGAYGNAPGWGNNNYPGDGEGHGRSYGVGLHHYISPPSFPNNPGDHWTWEVSS